LAAAILCNAFEWYDFAAYGILAIYIAGAFFPPGSPDSSLLAALAVFGVSFLVRPLGGLVLGGIGDSRGRKPALVIAATVMAAGTTMIGLLPSYEKIGILAPLLLLVGRLLQGLSAGGEFGTAAAFLVEWAPQGRRGFWTSFLSVTVALGTGLASAVAAVLINFLSPEQMTAFGWRIPFLIGGLFCLVGLWLRLAVEETPLYLKLRKSRASGQQATQTAAAVRANRRASLIVFGITIHWTVCYYMFLVYMPIFTRTHGQLSSAQSIWSNTICSAVIILLVPMFGSLSDRYGRRPFLLASCALTMLVTIPAFWLIATLPGFALVVAIQCMFGFIIALYSGAAPAVAVEHFTTYNRSRGASVSYALAAATFGGFAPFISLWLTNMFGNVLAPTAYVMVGALISFAVVVRMPETAQAALE